MKKSIILVVLTATLMLFVTGCAKQKMARCTAPGDAPQNHYAAGMEALEQFKFDAAQAKFERAVYCDENYSLAYGGLAIVYAYKTSQQRDPGFSSVERKRAIEYVEKAGKTAGTPEEKFAHYLSIIRANIFMDGENWVSKTEDAYKLAKILTVDESRLLYYQSVDALDYFMGLAWLRAHEFQKARGSFTAVLNARKDSKWKGFADRAWKKTDRIQRATAGVTIGDIGKRIAVKDVITRGDLATLLVAELKIDKLSGGRIPDSQPDKRQEFTPPDIAGYPFKEEVIIVMKWKVRGLEPKYDETAKAYLFKPMDLVKRGEMALVLEDVLIKITGDEKIATAYFGHDKSPFPDVRPTSPLYNAVMNVTTRGIMEGETSGEFMAERPVSGEEAILAVRTLKQKMNIK
jgi:tetratricopeptide (TPR) repeat protein